MLQQLMENVHNYFVEERVAGHYEVAAGAISLPFLLFG